MMGVKIYKTPPSPPLKDGEEWRRVSGYDHLFVSNTGRVFSTKRGNVLKHVLNSSGYGCIPVDVKTKLRVHRLVAEAYIQNPHGKPVVNHIDGNKLNNLVSNLEWVTVKENTIHAHSIGLCRFGSAHHYAKLEANQVRGIRNMQKDGVTRIKIAAHFKISKSTVDRVLAGTSWKHIV